MPNYSVKCDGTCEGLKEMRLSFDQYDQARKGDLALMCPDCGESSATLVFNPGNLGFILREGESGGWASKSLKENKFRESRNRIMAKRERDHVKKNQLVPNYEGVEASSWRDVQDHVRTVKGAEAAATYDPLVKQDSTK
jgi:hypothetical protein